MIKMFNEFDEKLDSLLESASHFIKDYIEEDDYTLDWEDFHKKHPLVLKEDYEMGVKRFQEM